MNHATSQSFIDVSNTTTSSLVQQHSSKDTVTMSSDNEADSQATVESDFRAIGPLEFVSTSILLICILLTALG